MPSGCSARPPLGDAKALLKLEENQLYLGYYEYEGGYGVLLCCSGSER